MKGINAFERHIEKIVLAAAAIVLVGVLMWQFIGPKATVNVGTGRDQKAVALNEAYEAVRLKALQTQAEIEKEAKELPEWREGSIARSFEESLSGSVAPSKRLAWSGGSGVKLDGGAEFAAPGADASFAALEAPAPREVSAQWYIATIHPEEVIETPELAPFLPAEQPMDKAWVTVESGFDGAALRAALERDPDGLDGPGQPLRRHWWDGRTELLVVMLERQAMAADGSWGEAETVPVLPGRFSLAPELAKGVENRAFLDDLVGEAKENKNLVRRARFYSVVYGEDWLPPSQAMAAPTADPDVGREREMLTRQREIRIATIARLRQQADALTELRDAARRQTIEARIQREETQLLEDEARLRALGAAIDGGESAPDRTQVAMDQIAEMEETEKPLLENPDVRLWAHDITAERGKTYRYRMRVVVNNPLFGNGAALPADQQPLAEPPAVVSAASGWSEPVAVPPETMFFVTSAQEKDAVTGAPKAAAEVFTFKWGYWRSGSVTLEPGDKVVADIRVPQLPPIELAVSPDQPGGERPGEEVPPPRGPRTTGAPPTAPTGPGGEGDAPPEITFDRVTVTVEAYLLDVATAPATREGRSRPSTEAFFRNTVGGIEAFIPELQRNTLAYRLASASARRGQDLVAPKPKERTTGPGGRDPGRVDKPPPAGPGGKGPGGG